MLNSELDVAQAERILADSEAQVPPLRIELARAINTIGVLLGQFPRDLHDELVELSAHLLCFLQGRAYKRRSWIG